MPLSSSGLGRRPLTPVTRVQIPYGVPTESCEPLGSQLFLCLPQAGRSVWRYVEPARNRRLGISPSGQYIELNQNWVEMYQHPYGYER